MGAKLSEAKYAKAYAMFYKVCRPYLKQIPISRTYQRDFSKNRMNPSFADKIRNLDRNIGECSVGSTSLLMIAKLSTNFCRLIFASVAQLVEQEKKRFTIFVKRQTLNTRRTTSKLWVVGANPTTGSRSLRLLNLSQRGLTLTKVHRSTRFKSNVGANPTDRFSECLIRTTFSCKNVFINFVALFLLDVPLVDRRRDSSRNTGSIPVHRAPSAGKLKRKILLPFVNQKS